MLRTLLHSSYEFKKKLFEFLPVTDLSNAVRALGITLTQREKQSFLNPIRVFFDDFNKLEKLMRQGWRITIYGNEIEHVLREIFTPEKVKLPPAQKWGSDCSILFSQPRHSVGGSYLGSRAEFDEVLSFVKGISTSEWRGSQIEVDTYL